MPMEGGTKIERSFSGGAPARGVGVYVGDELLNMTRRQQIRKFEVEPHRLVMAINIPKRELAQNSGKVGNHSSNRRVSSDFHGSCKG